METFTEKYQTYLNKFNEYLEKFYLTLNFRPEILGKSMRYSLEIGGKRIRPILAMSAADLFGITNEDIMPYALALEMIHTYSLIHDDLPGMDNDDFRRGKPSNHKVFGEGNAILAGDALLNTAYSILFEQCLKGEKYIRAAKCICDAAGIKGMIAGQSADLLYTNETDFIQEEDLQFIDSNKTGKLISAPLLVACILADSKNYFEFEQFGINLGFLFQITDDILDVTGSSKVLGKSIGKDEKENKLTYVRLYGLEDAKIKADMYAQSCKRILEKLEGDTTFFYSFVEYVRNRNK